MISREKCLELAKESGYPMECDAFGWGMLIGPHSIETIEAIINRAYAEGQRDMRERAANKAEQTCAPFTSMAISVLDID